jgi:transketolase
MPAGWEAAVSGAIADCQSAGAEKATRASSRDALEIVAPHMPELFGGSADLTGSNCTLHSGSTAIERDSLDGNYLYYGVREFAMAAISNGLALHGGLLPYGGTFLTFSDYSRNALRMAALMRIPGIHVFTHDSIGLGEDGPTHQPVEHIASLRIMPNMTVWRPCDSVETLAAWTDAAARRDGPTSLVLSRQKLRHQERTQAQVAAISRGGYVLVDAGPATAAIIIATGSEVELACEAAAGLAADGIHASVVSMPCTSLFDAQDAGYRQSVLPDSVKVRVAVEAGVTEGWRRYVGDRGHVIGLDRYGESAPAPELYARFEITAEAIAGAVKLALESRD